ncbi:unnamed protein product, partial [marine sediment metagenome]
KVTAHSGGKSAHRAVVAGVDCLEHGTMISDETIKLMAEKGTFLCPTVEQGKLADLIVVEENPPENISNLRKLKMVFKDGKPVNLARDEGQASFWELYF